MIGGIIIKRRFILLFSVVLFVCIFFLTCCQSNVVGHQIVGVWEHEGEQIEFRTDGYMKNGDKKYKYTVTEKKVTIDKDGEAVVLEYTINSNGTMTMNGIIYYPVDKK